MRTIILAALAAMLATPAAAQLVSPLNPPITPEAAAQLADQVDQARTLAATACQPSAVVPPMETPAGAAGSGKACRLVNSVQPRITRTASCNVATAAGITSCTAAWDGSGFPDGATIRLAGAPAAVTTTVGTSAEQPIACKAYAMTTTSISFRCWQSQTTALNLSIVTAGLSLLPFATVPTSVTVQVTGIMAS